MPKLGNFHTNLLQSISFSDFSEYGDYIALRCWFRNEYFIASNNL